MAGQDDCAAAPVTSYTVCRSSLRSRRCCCPKGIRRCRSRRGFSWWEITKSGHQNRQIGNCFHFLQQNAATRSNPSTWRLVVAAHSSKIPPSTIPFELAAKTFHASREDVEGV